MTGPQQDERLDRSEEPAGPITVLGIETSCDETAAACVRDGIDVLSSVVSSQVDLHARYGGVVPEIASRAHNELIIPVTARALVEAGLDGSRIDAVAATTGPGLIGALLVGVSAAKALALTWGVEAFKTVAVEHTDQMVRQVDEELLRIGRVKEGDLVVIIAGSPPGIPGSTNALRIHRMGDAINEVAPAYRSR